VDPSYYAQFYRPGADSDGRVSPFASAGATTKYNSNVAVLPTPNSQTPQEVCIYTIQCCFKVEKSIRCIYFLISDHGFVL